MHREEYKRMLEEASRPSRRRRNPTTGALEFRYVANGMHGGHGESLLPPYTRESVSLSLSVLSNIIGHVKPCPQHAAAAAQPRQLDPHQRPAQ